MNRCYKVIWSHAKQAYVVVSEISSQRRKSGSLRKLVSVGLSLLLISHGALVFAQGVTQNDSSDSEVDIQNVSDMEKEGQNEIDVVAGVKYLETPTLFADLLPSKNKISIGANAVASGATAIAIGSNATSLDQGGVAIGAWSDAGYGAIAVGHGAKTGEKAVSLGDNANASAKNSIAIGNLATSTAENSVAIGANSKVTVKNAVSFGSDELQRKLINIADGELSNASKEAVNGSQLHKTNEALNAVSGRVSTNETNIAQNKQDITDVSGRVSINETNIAQNKQDITNVSDRVSINETNIAQNKQDITDVSDRVSINETNIAQNKQDITDVSERVSTNETNIAQNKQDITDVSDRVSTNETNIAQNKQDITNVSERVSTNETNIAQNKQDITNVSDRVSTNETDIQSVMDGKAGLLVLGENSEIIFNPELAADHTQFNIGGVDSEGGTITRKMTGLTSGAITENSTDAINGSQLYATGQSVATALGGGAVINADGTISAPTYTVGGEKVNDIGKAFSNVDGRITENTENIGDIRNNINNIVAGTGGLIELSEDKSAIQVNENLANGATSFVLGGRVLSGIKDGKVEAGSTEAINGGQLFATSNALAKAIDANAGYNEDGEWVAPELPKLEDITGEDGKPVGSIGEALTTINNNVTNVLNGKAGLIQLSEDKTSLVVDKTLGQEATIFDFSNGETGRKLTGLANGEVKEGSTDAVTGAQLFETEEKVKANTAEIEKNTASIGDLNESLAGINVGDGEGGEKPAE
ncbi:hypothetical protein HX037_09820, partial [Ignatzschineria indica]|uniref:ESPR-type extended signal peptide-containing protein n=1 Tax=Ignatzschineria indica TaxID=472583 RepID=UPI002575B8C8